MLGNFGNIFRVTQARAAEPSNARLEIKRDESQNHDRKDKDHHTDACQGIAWEDTTEVSVTALQAFLHTLLYGDTASPSSGAGQNSTNSVPSSKASRAASAYQSTAKAVHDPNIATTPVDITEGDTPVLDSSFDEDERSKIKNYISELNHLNGLGVGVLVIQRNLTFLDAIKDAIERTRVI